MVEHLNYYNYHHIKTKLAGMLSVKYREYASQFYCLETYSK